jgi:hypothetical protein
MLGYETMCRRRLAASIRSRLSAGSCLLGLGFLGCSGESSPVHGPEASASCESAAQGACAPSSIGASSVSPATSATNPPAATSVGEVQAPTPSAGGTYVVPVPEVLAPFATFPIARVRLEEKGSEWELSYDLPALLVGEERRIALRGSVVGSPAEAGVYELRGDAGRATCRELGGMWSCEEALTNLTIDGDKLDDELARVPDAEAAPRREVAERFAVDPIGVLTFAASQD